jgi:CubicO group peptidase (beta-lactamase class C family)
MPEYTRVASQRTSLGFVSSGFESLRDEFDSHLLSDANLSAQLAIYHRGELVVDLFGGAEFDEDSVTSPFSATKGISALVIAKLVEDGLLDLEERVATYWPEFGVKGKADVTVAQLLSHQSGLLGPEGGYTMEDMVDHRIAAAKMATQRPIWAPGSMFGYHGVAVGVFMEELVCRITTSTLKEMYENEIRAPRDIDFYLNLPEDQDHRYRELRPAQRTPQQLAQAGPPRNPFSLVAFALAEWGRDPVDPANVWFTPNLREFRASAVPAATGVGSARGLAKAYASALGHIGDPYLSRDTLELMSQQRSWGQDRVLNAVMNFGTVYMRPNPNEDFGSLKAFGHDGGGGAIGFADPLFEMGFGYIPLPVQHMGGGDYAGGKLAKPVKLSELARDAIRRLS